MLNLILLRSRSIEFTSLKLITERLAVCTCHAQMYVIITEQKNQTLVYQDMTLDKNTARIVQCS